MKRIFLLILAMSLAFTPLGYSTWDKDEPLGTRNASDIDAYMGANQTALEDSLEELHGWLNLSVTRPTAATVLVTATHIYLQGTALDGALMVPILASTVSETLTISSSGASGLDTGAEAASTWYYIWIIAKADGTVNGLLSASSSDPTMPTGYVYKTLVSAVYNDSGSDFIDFEQISGNYWYSTWRSMASGNVGIVSWTSIDTTTFVPSALSTLIQGTVSAGDNSKIVAVANDSTIPGVDPTSSVADANRMGAGFGAYGEIPFFFNLKTANTMYWVSDTTTAEVFCAGFIINKLT